ncbi:peroxisomal carnitine O-octanoyltransferase-like isoform X2 [Asterias amurensis]|uniref:peroxisomal carnitine O-octanoyltransferase-like isoform X2 n=1 Tax=Asterias amurensis TaxID=7602 RepID=UPI003AB2423D
MGTELNFNPRKLHKSLPNFNLSVKKRMSTSSASSPRERTFQYEDSLPSLTLPPLEQTLQKYLESTKPFLTEDEFKKTEEVVRAFGDGIGLKLHRKLQEKARTSKNWLEHWWEELAYMSGRSPLAVQCNINGLGPYNDNIWHPMEGTQCERAAISIWYQMGIFLTLRREQFPVDKSRTGKAFSMNQMRGLYNCSRVPGEVRDKLVRFFKTEREGPCPNHLVVFSNGHVFSMRPFDVNGQVIPAQEIYRQLCYIKKLSQSRGQAVGVLTADDRTSFAKAYKHLRSLDPVNGQHLDHIEQAVITVQLDDACPKTPSEFMEATIKGDVYSRWGEKSYNLICFSNGVIACNGDHAPFDGMVIVTINDVIYKQLVKTSGQWPTKDSSVGMSYKSPEELIFTVDDVIKRAMEKAINTFNTNASNLLVLASKSVAFGKRWAKLHKLHPDSVFQLALLFAYYALHGKPAATYETATTRQFYHGRTETVRSCTIESVKWCQAMLDSSKSTSERQALFLAALTRHNANMADAVNAHGCDRHLLGLQAIAMEEGLPMPALYTDPAYTKSGGGGNFKLSTSCTGYFQTQGFCAPMVKDGYGAFYSILDNHYMPCILTFKSDEGTDIKRFFVSLNASLMAIKNLFMDNSKM